jgi:hypothetical protein
MRRVERGRTAQALTSPWQVVRVSIWIISSGGRVRRELDVLVGGADMPAQR